MANESADCLVVGAGPAGLAAAIELKRRDIGNVVVIDREPEGGGIPRLCNHTGFGLRDMHRVYTGPKYARRYVDQARAAGVKICCETTVTGWLGDREIACTSPQGISSLQAGAILLATGCRERPASARLIPGRRLQGVFTTGSLQRFVYEHKLPVGKRAVIVGAELVSLSALMTLWHGRVETAAMITELPRHQIYFPFVPMKWLLLDVLKRASLAASSRVLRILGDKRVEAVEVANTITQKTETISCDTVVFTGSWIPEHEIARLGGLAMDWNTRGPQIDSRLRSSAPGVFAAGNLLRGAEAADISALEGRLAGEQMHRFLQDENWPERRLGITCSSPLAWICPNSVTPADGWTAPRPITFQVQAFCRSGKVHVYQDGKLLYTQAYGRLQPNRMNALATDWLAQVDFEGDDLLLTLGVKSD